MKLVITDAATVAKGDINLNLFSKYAELVMYDHTLDNEVAERIADADLVLCNKTKITREAMSGAKKLKFIGLFATGYNNIDIEYCNEHNITVSNAGSYSTDAVAQHTFALILEHFSHVGDYNAFCQRGEWAKSPVFSPFIYPTDEISGKTLGIVGYGSIGKAVKKIADAFGLKTIVYTRTVRASDNVENVSFDELLKRSDIITVHTPLTAQTANLFDYESFRKCKPTCLYINTARGGVNDEEALARALKEGRIACAGVDVLASEPMRKDCPLTGAPNLILTPHVAWTPITTRERLMVIVENNLKGFLEGKPENVVSCRARNN